MLNTLLPIKQNELANVARILIYKEDPSILTKVDLDDDQIFLEPLILTYFNRIQTNKVFPNGMLPVLMHGYLLKENQKQINVDVLCDEDGIAYVPTLGYYKKGETTPFEKIYKIPDTQIEVIKYNVPLLRNVIHIVSSGDPFEDEALLLDKKFFDANINALTNAIHVLKKNAPEYFSLLEASLKKCIFFKITSRLGSSFASINANGSIYFILNKDKEDEVYFIDTLGLCSGKTIVSTFLHDQNNLFKIDCYLRITDLIGIEDFRNIYTLFIDVFAHCTAAICLDKSINATEFTDKQKREIEVRLALYLKKCEVDMVKLKLIIEHFSGVDNVFLPHEVSLYNFMKTHIETITKERTDLISKIDYSNFHYRMGFSEFSLVNP